jgi:glycosyltransferase involved in cell wall biosynthesis
LNALVGGVVVLVVSPAVCSLNKKVGWFSDTFEQNNGIATYLQEILPVIKARDCFDVTLYTGRVSRDYSFPVESLKHLPFPLFPSYDVVLSPFKWFKCDVVHAHTPYLLGVKAAKLDVPKVVTAHFLPFHFIEWAFGTNPPAAAEKIGWAFESWFLNQFDVVVCQTRVGRKYFHKMGLKKPVQVIPNGMNLAKYKGGSAKRFYEHYGFKDFALFVGRVDASKHPEWIVEAARQLPKQLFVISGTGTMVDKLERLPNIKFLGRLSRSDLIDCYNAAIVALMPSKVETEGLVAQEAMACGTPVIISDNEVLREVVGDAGLVCRNADELAKHVVAIAGDAKLKKELSERALAKVAERDINKSVSALFDLYEELL